MIDSKEYPEPAAFIDLVRETAVSAARRAGAIQMHHFRNVKLRCSRLLFDVKIETDRVCENVIIATIREAFPDHSILTEETGELPGSGGYTWVVDPLDGTVNFWHGLPVFCVSIACYRNPDGTGDEPDGRKASAISGTPVAGAVYLPYMEEFFVAVHGRGATMNGRPLRVTAAENTADVVMSVSFGKTPEMMKRMTKRLDVLLPQVRKVRCLGAAAAELAYVAAGYLGGLIYEGIKPWDFAAGKILVEEAGGFLDAVETGNGLWRVVAGSRGIRESILSIDTFSPIP